MPGLTRVTELIGDTLFGNPSPVAVEAAEVPTGRARLPVAGPAGDGDGRLGCDHPKRTGHPAPLAVSAEAGTGEARAGVPLASHETDACAAGGPPTRAGWNGDHVRLPSRLESSGGTDEPGRRGGDPRGVPHLGGRDASRGMRVFEDPSAALVATGRGSAACRVGPRRWPWKSR